MELIDFILHVDRHLTEFVAANGIWVYALLFLIVFVETGFVVMPLLPGDSLLFAAGAIAATGAMDPAVLCLLLFPILLLPFIGGVLFTLIQVVTGSDSLARMAPWLDGVGPQREQVEAVERRQQVAVEAGGRLRERIAAGAPPSGASRTPSTISRS